MARRKTFTDEVLALIRKGDPLERLQFLLDIRDETPELRAIALGELLDDGWSKYAVAKELGLSPQATQAWRAAGPKRGRKR